MINDRNLTCKQKEFRDENEYIVLEKGVHYESILNRELLQDKKKKGI